MPFLLPTPSLARLSAVLLIAALAVCAPLAAAQTLPDIQQAMKQGQMPQALEKVDQYIAAKPKDPQGRFMKGLILTELGRTADAIAVFTRLTEDFPELPEPYNNLAVLYAQQKQYDKARSALEMAIRTHPSYAIAHENLGDLYAKLASQAYDKALQLDSSNKATQGKMSMIKELISTTSIKPSTKSATNSSKPASDPAPASAAAPTTPTTPAGAATSKPATTSAPATPAASAPASPASAATTTAAPVAVASAPASTGNGASKKPAEPEQKPAEKTPAGSASEADFVKLVQNWAAAWSRKDVKAYLGFYSADFKTPNGASRRDWEAERRQRIDRPGKLSVVVDNIQVDVAGDTATVRFRQQYVSPNLKSSARKTIVFVKQGSRWLIQQERVS